eukprot:GEMP01041738.1.p1 GENE.GEMP01041738.1~~GEMP01041738.1.p1  ORF type:complete len:426 (+),score=59.49 GEMP01041738.1:121-1398(+)
MRKLYVRAFAVCVVFSYALNSQNFRSVLTPILVGVTVTGGHASGTYKCENAHESGISSERNIFRTSVDGNAIHYTHEGKWTLVNAKGAVQLEAKEEGGSDPSAVKWPDDIAMVPITEPAVSNLLLLFICHISGLLYAPIWYVTKWGKSIVAESVTRYGVNHILLCGSFMTIAQMGINYCWTLASTRMPIQTLSSIFQSSAFLIYLLSIPVLGEKATLNKSLGVLLSAVGVIIASTYSPSNGPAVAYSSYGIMFALTGEVFKVVYQVWFKYVYDDPGLKFVFFMSSVIGFLHIVLILPLILLADSMGWERLHFNVTDSLSSILQVNFAAVCASMVNVGSLLVIAWSSPTLWSTTQCLIIPFSVALDYVFVGITPTPISVIGLLVICVALAIFHLGPEEAPANNGWRKVQSERRTFGGTSNIYALLD